MLAHNARSHECAPRPVTSRAHLLSQTCPTHLGSHLLSHITAGVTPGDQVDIHYHDDFHCRDEAPHTQRRNWCCSWKKLIHELLPSDNDSKPSSLCQKAEPSSLFEKGESCNPERTANVHTLANTMCFPSILGTMTTWEHNELTNVARRLSTPERRNKKESSSTPGRSRGTSLTCSLWWYRTRRSDVL